MHLTVGELRPAKHNFKGRATESRKMASIGGDAWIYSQKGKLMLQRFRKEYLVRKVRESVQNRALVAVAHAPDFSRETMMLLNEELQPHGATVRFQKNSLGRIGLKDAGLEPLVKFVKGPVALIAGDAEMPLAKAIQGLSKKINNWIVMGAMLDGRILLEWSDVDYLSKLPAPEIVHRDLIMQIQPGTALQVPNPAAYLVAILQQRESSLGKVDLDEK